jgi:hypothetical protein
VDACLVIGEMEMVSEVCFVDAFVYRFLSVKQRRGLPFLSSLTGHPFFRSFLYIIAGCGKAD